MCEKCAKVDEMIGQTFGKLTVLKRVENSKNRKIRYLCECECGNRKIIVKSSLMHGRTKSCGRCKEPRPGNTFGLLTVIKKSDKKAKDGHYYLECRCECGNTALVLSSSLRNGSTKSCGRCNEPRPGEKFGSLTVIKKSNKKTKDGRCYSECKCECGNTKLVVNSKLRDGSTKSCGRCNEIRSGNKFGLLTVIKKHDKKDKSGHYLFECLCECGNMTLVRGDNLRDGSTKSCGRCNEIRPGNKFGLLTVIKKSDKKDKYGNSYFECRCECGNTTLVRGVNLRNGRTKSCGCLGSSSGEFKIYNFLDANFISYTREREIKELTTSNGGHPRFDFEIFNKYGNSFFLEFHGEQHYWPLKDSDFGEQQREETDPMKIKYCESNNESLHIINCFEDVDSSLTRILYYREMLTPKRLERNKPVYKIKRTLFVDKDGHLSIFSAREDIQAAA